MSITLLMSNYNWPERKQVIYSLIGSQLMPHHLQRVQDVLKHSISQTQVKNVLKKYTFFSGTSLLTDTAPALQQLAKVCGQSQIFKRTPCSRSCFVQGMVIDFKIFGGHAYVYYYTGELDCYKLNGELVNHKDLKTLPGRVRYPLFSEKGSLLIVPNADKGIRIYDYHKQEFITQWLPLDVEKRVAVQQDGLGKLAIHGTTKNPVEQVIFYDGHKLVGVDHSIGQIQIDQSKMICHLITRVSKPGTAVQIELNVKDGNVSPDFFMFQEGGGFIFAIGPDRRLFLFGLNGKCLKEIQLAGIKSEERIVNIALHGHLLFSRATTEIIHSTRNCEFSEIKSRLLIHLTNGELINSFDGVDFKKIQIVGAKVFFLSSGSDYLQLLDFSANQPSTAHAT